ncbi:hypothetical protein QFZ77_002326 [Paenibacillus sp. V4I3]|nr:hypothetical protein [Paenibacillus sp. V4I3]MDQ0890401.1 hypothetical protein [Paenibacillus sp. V4I9]
MIRNQISMNNLTIEKQFIPSVSTGLLTNT